MSFFLGFDFGLKYIGVANGQLITQTASPITTIRATNGIPDWEQIDALVSEWAPKAIIIGLPLNMDGTEQIMTKRARKFANRVADRYNKLPIHLVDERLTSWEAKQNSSEKEDFDTLNAKAAAIILQQWLEYNK